MKKKIKTGPYVPQKEGKKVVLDDISLDEMISEKRKECSEIEYKNGISMVERLKPYVELNSLLHMKIMQILEKI